MKKLILLSLASGFLSLSTNAQTTGIDQDTEFLTPPTGGKFLRWHGHYGRSYFLQFSDPADHLKQWFWSEIIEGGYDQDITYEVDGTAEKGFFRLHYTDQTPASGETLETADFDSDGFTNLQEITPRLRPGGVPIGSGISADIQTNPLNSDTDHDGLLDKWEEDHGLDPTDNGTRDPKNGPNSDPDHDGLTNLQEQTAGTNPQSSDTDGDGISDAGEIEQSKDPTNPSDTPAAEWFVLVGDKPMGVVKTEIREFTIKKGQTRLVVVGTQSDEYPVWTEPSSEYDDTLDWTVSPSVGTSYIVGSIHVNDRHLDWQIDEINGTTLHGIGPAHIEEAKVIQAPLSADITVSVFLKGTNISDGNLPSRVIVGLLPLEFIDKSGAQLSELKVGKMYPGVITGTGLPGSVVSVSLDSDEDWFKVRVRDGAALSGIKMKFGTVDNPDSAYNDDPTQYTLETMAGDAVTKPMLLVSDDVDDHHEASYSGGKADNSPDDRTHKIQLGGSFKISEVSVGYRGWNSIDMKLLTKKKKTVKVQFVNCKYGPGSGTPCWTTAQIEWTQKMMQERYAQVGIEFDFLPVATGASVGIASGTLFNGEAPSFNAAAGKIDFPQETKDLIDHGPPNDLYNTLMIYLVRGLPDLNGVATPPKYVRPADIRFQNKILLANDDFRDFTSSHEALHVLTDAAHNAAPYNDFSTEYSDENTIWTVPTPEPQYPRRNNISIGSTKRISLAQEIKIQSSPLAK